jgi:SAM-dependent methyltransferase
MGGSALPHDAIALSAYDRLADGYAARIDAKAHNAFYERPATLALLPAVQGKCVLDAGCGPGVYAEWLLEHGAEVVAIEVSPRMVAQARHRLGGRATIHQADLGASLRFLDADSFDVIVSALVLDYVEDWDHVFREFFRLLRAPGHIVVSVGHPFDEFFDHHPGGNYFALERVEQEWRWCGPPTRVPYFRRPLQAMLEPLLGAGFVLERLVEPRPVPAFKEHDATDYEKLMRSPGFLCVRAKKQAA